VKADVALGTPETFYHLWRNLAQTALLEGFTEYAECEARCRRLRMFELGVIPGLFQTQAYAEALAAAEVRHGNITQEQADERVSYLLTRQHRLTLPSAPDLHAVLDESCLRRFVGGPAVMRDQFERLEMLTERPRTLIQVAPFSMGERRPFALPVVLSDVASLEVIRAARKELPS
jgi:hypothetical protein